MSNNQVKLNILPIDTHDVRTLGLADISFYPQSVAIVNPTIQITPPGYNKLTIAFTAKNVTIYNSTILEISCDDEIMIDLPDGIWKVKYTITPADTYFVEKSFLRTEKIQQLWGDAFLCLNASCSDHAKKLMQEELEDIWFLIQGAIADANQCNDMEAMNKYRLAMSMLNSFNCNK